MQERKIFKLRDDYYLPSDLCRIAAAIDTKGCELFFDDAMSLLLPLAKKYSEDYSSCRSLARSWVQLLQRDYSTGKDWITFYVHSKAAFYKKLGDHAYAIMTSSNIPSSNLRGGYNSTTALPSQLTEADSVTGENIKRKDVSPEMLKKWKAPFASRALFAFFSRNNPRGSARRVVDEMRQQNNRL